MNILLIGLRGSGKSTLGRLLAAQASRPFVDLDDITPTLLGKTAVADAFRDRGEPAFRTAELEALKRSLAAPNQVIALGGGTPTAPGAQDVIRTARIGGSAKIIYLRCSVETLRARLSKTSMTNRPSLTGAPPLDEIESVLAARDPLYQALADHVIDCDRLSTDDALNTLQRLLRKPLPPGGVGVGS